MTLDLVVVIEEARIMRIIKLTAVLNMRRSGKLIVAWLSYIIKKKHGQ